jgi:hypothetical protein
MKHAMKLLSVIGALAIVFSVLAFANDKIVSHDEDEKYYLMIAQPSDEAWKGVIEAGGDMAEPAGKAIEAMGGKLHSYYIEVGRPKNYGVVSFPSSTDIAKIVYMRTVQGVMKDIQFIEIIPSDKAAGLFKEVNELSNPK